MSRGIYGQYAVIVKVNGQAVGGFSEVTGLASDGSAVDYREGNDPQSSPRKLPPHRFNVVTLTRGVVHDTGFSGWLKNARTRQHLAIERYDAGGRLLWSRALMDCAITEHKSKGSAIEQLTLTYHHQRPS